jgi:phosphatidylcholine synthase
VPSRYLYPTQPGRLNRLTNGLGAAWALLLVVVLWLLGQGDNHSALQVAVLSLYFPLYYFVASWVITVRLWRRQRRARAGDHLAPASG